MNQSLHFAYPKRTRGKDKQQRCRPIKPERTLTVSSANGYQYKQVPALRLNGLWLEDFDFHQGDKVSVHCENGKLIIEKLEDEESSGIIN